jgi:thiol-disulfide isomerase/thioredoxin
MQKQTKKWLYLILLFIAVFSMAAFYHLGTFAISPINAQTAAPSDDQPDPRFQALQNAIQPDEDKITSALGQTDMVSLFSNPASNRQMVAAIVPPIRDIIDQFDAFSHKNPDLAGDILPVEYHFLAVLSILGDAQSQARLQQDSASGKSAVAQAASLGSLEFDWWKNISSASAQAQVLAKLKAMAIKDPNDDSLTAVAFSMSQAGAANDDLADQARQIILNNLTGQYAQQIQAQLQMQEKQDALLNKPIDVQSITLDGKPFSTGSLKGHVVVVDYWATWCEWCVKGLPDLTAIYQKYHKNGLEIVSISNDSDINALKQFLAQHPEMAWPQIFDAAHPGLNPTAAQYGITGFPTQFVIDREGVLRNVIVGYDPDELTKDVDAAMMAP